MQHPKTIRGFTLMETMIATGILVTGLVAVTSMFAYAARTEILNEQRSTATLLANSKLEDFSAVSDLTDLTAGGSLTVRTTGYFEYVSISSSGVISRSASDSSFPYVRLWEISGANPMLVSVSVYAMTGGVNDSLVELVRGSKQLTSGFARDAMAPPTAPTP